MDFLWSPWRYRYIKEGGAQGGCVFCAIAEAPAEKDDENLIVLRGEHNFVVLNRYPYTSGHAMVIPYQHWGALTEATEEALGEMMRWTRRLEGALRNQYRPEGVNIGMNVGKAAGAGVAGHIHMHALPRWIADSNFITTIGETRVLPEELDVTLEKLRGELRPALNED